MCTDSVNAFGLEVPLPQFQRVKQSFPRPKVSDVTNAAFQAMDRFPDISLLCRGKRIAVTAGSRGIIQYPEIMTAVIKLLRSYGSDPFIVPAMGSHGGATAEGQIQLLADLGVTESSVGAPIRSSMEVVEVGKLPNGMPVFMDRIAACSDGIVLVNRIKPHTDFTGELESGFAKILALGLGKHKGAAAIHSYGVEGLQVLMPMAARLVIQNMPVLFGLASIENAYHEIAQIVALPPEGIAGKEEIELLKRTYSLMSHIPFPEIDVLIIEEMGKNISGVGMDTNVIGRMKVHGVPDDTSCNIRVITVLNLTKESHGNAAGIGLADVTTQRFVNQINFDTLYVNCITAGLCGLQRCAIPMVAPNDRASIMVAVNGCGQPDPLQARIVRRKNTLSLGETDISECLVHHVNEGGRSRVNQ